MDEDNSVSFIVPVYNVGCNLISQCINSLKNQIEKEDEIIIVDDGSKLNIADFLDTLRDKNVKIIHKENGGVSSARNVGLDIAKSKWICFVDPDDFFMEGSFNAARAYLQSNSDIYIFDYYAVDEEGIMKCYSFFDSLKEVSKEDIHISLLDDIGESLVGCGVPWAHIYNLNFLRKNNLTFDTKCIRAQDNIFNMYAIECAMNFEVIHKAFYVYRYIHCAQYYNSFNRKVLDYLPYIAQLKVEFYKEHSYSEKISNLCMRFAYNSIRYIVDCYCFSKEHPKENEQKERYFENLRRTDLFAWIRENSKNLSLGSRVLFWLLDHRWIGAYKTVLVVKSKL